MKCCPFCGGTFLGTALLRVMCRECGASGPTSPDPEAAWEMRAPKQEEPESFLSHLSKLLERDIEMGEYDEDFIAGPDYEEYEDKDDDALRVDGTAQSVNAALTTIIDRARKKYNR